MEYYKETESKLQQIYPFNALVYTKHWLQSSNGVDAPVNDLLVIKKLKEFEVFYKSVSIKTSMVFKNHFRYWIEEVAVF